MKKLLPIFIGLSLGSFSFSSQAENLLQVYQQAKESNPELRKAMSDRDIAYEKISESRASLLPQLNLSGSYGINRGYKDNRGNKTNNASGKITLNQSIFDYSRWKTLSLTEKQASIQDVSYKASEQTLILNSATSYFNILSALDTLSLVEAKKQAIGQQLEQTKQRFNVGLVAITDVYTAQAQYDQTLADEVNARNTLENVVEVLRQITNVYYTELSSLNTQIFSTERPSDVDALLKQAENNNLNLLSARLGQDLSREQIRLARSGHLPTLDLNASSTLSNNKNKGDRVYGNDTTAGMNQAAIVLSIPLYSGGQTNSKVQQAQHGFVGASEMLESAHRGVIQSVRSSYNNISASISSIQAYKQAVVSAESSLKATTAGYSVGTRTIVDVLNATTALYDAKTKLSTARYNYLINQLNMKSALGTLNEQDIMQLNETLGKSITTNPIASYS